MATTHSPAPKKGTWLVIGLLVLATVLVIISRVYRTPPPGDLKNILRQEGMPAARRGMTLAQEGKKLLPVEEQREMDALYTTALQTLTPEERQRFLTHARKGPAASDSEITESTELIDKALRSLPPDKNARLWALVDKAVQLQLAQGGEAPAPTEQTTE